MVIVTVNDNRIVVATPKYESIYEMLNWKIRIVKKEL